MQTAQRHLKPQSDFSRAFIDLARLGRTDWQATALTILLVAFLSIVSNLIVLIFTGWSLYFEHFHVVDVGRLVLSSAANPVSGIFGFWLACTTILRRPFRSLISTDLTFNIRRFLLGAALYLPGNVLALVAMSLYASMRVGRWTIPFGHFEWPHGGSSAGQIFGMVAACLGILFAAFGEELFFRSWMTQTLGQYVRFPTIVVAIVAVLFSAAHTQYDWPLKIVMLICSVGFSVLSLRDQRLELAVGAHSMMNICAMLQSVFFAGSLSYAPASAALSAHTPAFVFDGFSIAILKGVLPFVLMYLVLQKTNGWFPSKDALHEAT